MKKIKQWNVPFIILVMTVSLTLLGKPVSVQAAVQCGPSSHAGLINSIKYFSAALEYTWQNQPEEPDEDREGAKYALNMATKQVNNSLKLCQSGNYYMTLMSSRMAVELLRIAGVKSGITSRVTYMAIYPHLHFKYALMMAAAEKNLHEVSKLYDELNISFQ